jgi:hypothetical protein
VKFWNFLSTYTLLFALNPIIVHIRTNRLGNNVLCLYYCFPICIHSSFYPNIRLQSVGLSSSRRASGTCSALRSERLIVSDRMVS